MQNYKKFIIILLIFSFLVTFFPRPARADYWGAAWGAAILKQTLEEMYTKIKETVIATLKMNAIRTVQSRMMSMMGGAGGQPQIVTNWRETIYGSANRDANVVVKDYFTQAKSGTGTGGQKIVSTGEKIYNDDPRSVKPTIDKYVQGGDVSKIFDKNYTPNPAQALNDLSKMRNYPIFYSTTAQGIYAVEYGERSGAEAAKDIAYGGYKGTDNSKNNPNDKSGAVKNEQITMPGSTKRDVVSEVMNMPNKMVTLARSIPEIVAAMVTQMLTRMINQGFSMMNSQINNVMRSSGASTSQIQSLIQKGIK